MRERNRRWELLPVACIRVSQKGFDGEIRHPANESMCRHLEIPHASKRYIEPSVAIGFKSKTRELRVELVLIAFDINFAPLLSEKTNFQSVMIY